MIPKRQTIRLRRAKRKSVANATAAVVNQIVLRAMAKPSATRVAAVIAMEAVGMQTLQAKNAHHVQSGPNGQRQKVSAANAMDVDAVTVATSKAAMMPPPLRSM